MAVAVATVGGSDAVGAVGQFLALLAPSVLAGFCGHWLAGCLPKHSMHTCAKWHLGAILASFGVVAEADRLAFRCPIGARFELLSALAILALAVALSAFAAFLGRRQVHISVPGLRPLSVQS